MVTQSAVHFTLTTHLKNELDLKSAVRRLLGSDIAVSAAWPSEMGIRVTPRMRKLARLLERAESLREDFDGYQQSPSLGGAAKFALRHPVLFAQSMLRHESKDHSPTEAQDGSSTPLVETLEVGTGVLLDAQKISSVEREIDARLFGGSSRDFDKFVRLNLRGSYHDVRLPNSTDTFHVVFEPRLLIHESGILQLTIAVPIDTFLTTSQLIRLSRSDRAIVVKSQVPEPLIAYTDDGRWLPENDAGARLRERVSDDGWSVAALLHEHVNVIARALKSRSRSRWSIHATVFAAPGTCCKSGEAWRNNHEVDVARIAARHQPKGSFAHERLVGPNLALEHDSFLTANIGSTTKIDYAADPREPFGELDTVLLVEHVMLQFCRLEHIEDRVSRPRLYGRALRRLQHDAIGAFTDMRQHELRYGSARDIATHLLDELGAQEMRRTIETALDLASQANATQEASAQARRSMTLTWVATILAALVAIPALADLLDLAAEIDPTTGFSWLLAPFHWLAGLGGWGPWLIVLVLIVAVILRWLIRKLWWVARVLWIVWRALVGRRGPLVPQQFTLTAELHEETNESEVDDARP